MRADARRNRAQILDAARALVAEVGVDATMEDIARRAHVAVGTLYRHFPAKEDLVTAVVEDSIEQITTLAERARDAVDAGAPAGPELAGLFRAIAHRSVADRAVKAAAGRLDIGPAHAVLPDVEVPTDGATARAVAAITVVLDRARAGGAVRDDVTLADMVLLLAGVPGVEVADRARARYVEIVLAGLAPNRGDVGSPR